MLHPRTASTLEGLGRVDISDPPALFKGVGKIHASDISAPASIRKAARPIQYIRTVHHAGAPVNIAGLGPLFKDPRKIPPAFFIEVEKIPHPFFKEVVKTP